MSWESTSVVVDVSDSVVAVVTGGVVVEAEAVESSYSVALNSDAAATAVSAAPNDTDAVASVLEAGPPGASAFDVWLARPGNAGKTIDEFLASLRGPPGTTPISTDADNRLTTGADGGLHVPEIAVDPLAYYILAKA